MSLPGFIPSMVLVLNTGSCSHQALQPCPSSHMPVPCHTGLLDHTRQFSSVTQSCLTLCNPMDCNTPGFPVHHQLPELTQTHVYQVDEAIQPSHPLLSPSPLIFNLSQHQVFSNESVLCIRWPKYWSFSFSISPSNEYSGLIALGWTDWISLQSKGLSRVFSNTTVQKHQFLRC